MVWKPTGMKLGIGENADGFQLDTLLLGIGFLIISKEVKIICFRTLPWESLLLCKLKVCAYEEHCIGYANEYVIRQVSMDF